jgi:FkbM family methyltransferase
MIDYQNYHMQFKKSMLFLYKKGLKFRTGYRLTKFYPIKILYRVIISSTRSLITKIPINVQGHKMYIDSKDSLQLFANDGIFEESETKLVKRVIKKGDTVLDIGANIGYYTLIFANLVGNEGKVFAFEPDPMNFSLLKKNIKINRYKNVILENKAVSNKTGKIKLYLGDSNRAINRIYDAKIGDATKSIEIDAVKLDEYFKNYDKKIDFIKIDVEGSESSAFEGMSSILKKTRNLKMMTEFYPFLIKKFGGSPEQYLNLLLNFGFNLYDVQNIKTTKMKPTNPSELLTNITPEKKNNTYLFCIKE